jgi:hypothetical protein
MKIQSCFILSAALSLMSPVQAFTGPNTFSKGVLHRAKSNAVKKYGPGAYVLNEYAQDIKRRRDIYHETGRFPLR